MKKLIFALLLFSISINAQTREDYINYIDEYTKYKDVFETEQGSFKFSNISNKYTLILDSKFGDNSISSSCSFSENEIKEIKLVKYILDDNNKSVEIGFILNVNKCKHIENRVNKFPSSKENNYIIESVLNLVGLRFTIKRIVAIRFGTTHTQYRCKLLRCGRFVRIFRVICCYF
jgi:hypothetical protein